MTRLLLMWATVLGVAALTVIALLAADFGRSNATTVAVPTAPPDCHVAGQPSPGGPAAPTNLTVSYLPGTSVHNLHLQFMWTDNSQDETCFVIEMKLGGAILTPFETHAVVQSDSVTLIDGPYAEGESIQFRMYAANQTGRSAYSNTASAGIPYYDSTTPSPPATPTPTAEATPLASSTPDPQSIITVRFTNGGLLVAVMVSGIRITADGVECPYLQPGVVVAVSEYSIGWPIQDSDSPLPCHDGPPSDLVLRFSLVTSRQDESVDVKAAINWQGGSLQSDLSVPAEFVSTASPAAPTPTPGALPDTGGRP